MPQHMLCNACCQGCLQHCHCKIPLHGAILYCSSMGLLDSLCFAAPVEWHAANAVSNAGLCLLFACTRSYYLIAFACHFPPFISVG